MRTCSRWQCRCTCHRSDRDSTHTHQCLENENINSTKGREVQLCYSGTQTVQTWNSRSFSFPLQSLEHRKELVEYRYTHTLEVVTGLPFFHYRWLTASIKPRLLFPPCMLCFLWTFLFMLTILSGTSIINAFHPKRVNIIFYVWGTN